MKTAQASDWQTNPLPEERITIPLERTFSPEEMSRIRQGLIPEEMEDKWFIYWQEDTLYFHRSWTGNCIYIVHFAADGDSARMVSAEVNRDPEQYKETKAELDVAMISSLIDLLLLHYAPDLPKDGSPPEEQAIKNWSNVGRAMLGQHPDDS